MSTMVKTPQPFLQIVKLVDPWSKPTRQVLHPFEYSIRPHVLSWLKYLFDYSHKPLDHYLLTM